MRQYIIYIAIAIIASFLGAAVHQFYGKGAINSLQEEIDNEKKESIDAIKDHQAEIDTLTHKSDVIKRDNETLRKLIAAERNKRIIIKKQDSTFVIITDEDSLLNYLRYKLN